jgi:hypothetical protein
MVPKPAIAAELFQKNSFGSIHSMYKKVINKIEIPVFDTIYRTSSICCNSN